MILNVAALLCIPGAGFFAWSAIDAAERGESYAFCASMVLVMLAAEFYFVMAIVRDDFVKALKKR